MKILYVSGYNRMILFNKLIPTALKEIGLDVYEFDWNSVLPFNKTIRIFSDAAINKKRGERLIAFAKKINPDFIFVLKGEPFTPQFLKELKNVSSAKMFNWFGDDPWEFPIFSSKVAPCYDFFFTYDPYSVQLYKNTGYENAFHLPYGYDFRITEPLAISHNDRKKYECEISFIGSHYPERENLLSRLSEKFEIKIWGRGWKNSTLSRLYQGHALYGLEMMKALKCGKIILNVHKGFDKGASESGEGLNLRVMEAAACGSFQVSNFQKDIPNRFINDEIKLFYNENELVEILKQYSGDESSRKQIGNNALSRLKKDHTLKQRMEEIFSLMKVKI